MRARTPGAERGAHGTGRERVSGFFALLFVGCSALSVPSTRGEPAKDAPAHNEPAQKEPAQAATQPAGRAPPGGPARLAETTISAAAPPFERWTAQEFEAKLLRTPAELGPASIGEPNRGALMNGVPFPAGPLWIIAHADRAFATPVAVETVSRAIASVNERFPGSAPLYVGDMSAPRGGWLRPHRSHQSGRDIDLGYYYTERAAWYVPATADNLDRARTWALVEALIAEGHVERIFMDELVQALLADHALHSGEDPAWVAAVFGGPELRDPIVAHAWGHRTHLHVRVHDALSEARGRRVHPHLVRLKRMR